MDTMNHTVTAVRLAMPCALAMSADAVPSIAFDARGAAAGVTRGQAFATATGVRSWSPPPT